MRTRRLLWLVLAPLVTVGGCGPAPHVPSPVERGEIEALVQSYRAEAGRIEGLRGSGRGEFTTSGRTLPFAFAFVWSRDGWLRADVRPELSVAAGWTSLLFVRGDSVRVYLPARGVEVREGLSPRLGSWTLGKLVTAALGLPEIDFLMGIEDMRTAGTGKSLIVTGSLDGTSLEAEMGRHGGPSVGLDRISATWPDGQTLALRYGGRGWKEGSAVPRTVSIAFSGNGSRSFELVFEYRKLANAEDLSREEYAYRTPPGVHIVGFEDLGLWRQP
jgi:hypothetical protein